MEYARYDIQGNGLISIRYDGITEFLEIEGKIIALNTAGSQVDFIKIFPAVGVA